jgi:hypothetical protein
MHVSAIVALSQFRLRSPQPTTGVISISLIHRLIRVSPRRKKSVALHCLELHLGFVHHTHTTTAQLLDDAVVRDGLPNHGS